MDGSYHKAEKWIKTVFSTEKKKKKLSELLFEENSWVKWDQLLCMFDLKQIWQWHTKEVSALLARPVTAMQEARGKGICSREPHSIGCI